MNFKMFTIILWVFTGMTFAQTPISSQKLLDGPMEIIDELDFTNYSIKDFSEGYDVAYQMINDTISINSKIKGTNLLAALAKELSLKVKSRVINLNDEGVMEVIQKYESQHYFVNRPVVSQFMKLMNYTCQGDYGHIIVRFKSSRLFYPVIIVIGIYILLLVLNLSGKLKWRFKKYFNLLSFVMLILGLVIAIGFKATCEENIQDYLFYGISM